MPVALMVKSAFVVSLEATSTFVAGKAMPITMIKGTTVQPISTQIGSASSFDWCPTDLRCFQME